MTASLTFPAAAVACLATLLALCAASAAQAGGPTAQVKRGQYLVNTSGCHDCHTPLKMGANGPEPDMSRMLSGHPEALAMPPVPSLPEGPWLATVAATNTAWAGPWGVSFTANLTPDAETGLGQWTLQNFNDQDLAAIYAYLRTVPALKNRVPEPWAPLPTTAAK